MLAYQNSLKESDGLVVSNFTDLRNLGFLHNLNIHYPGIGALSLHPTYFLLKNSSSSIPSGLTDRKGREQ